MNNIKILILLITLGLAGCKDVFFEVEPTNSALGNFMSVWNTFNEKYAVFEQRNVDWDEVYNTYRPQVNDQLNDDQLYEIITSMLSHLDDGHVSLMASNKPFWSSHKAFRENATANHFNFSVIRRNYLSNFKNYNNQIYYGKIVNNIGYIYISHFSGDKPFIIDEIIAQMSEYKGIIIDLRWNNGGDFTNGEIIASRFADQRRLAFSGMAKNGPGRNDYGKKVDYFVEPKGPKQFTKPVVMITDRYTISAGENMVLYFREFPHVTVIGENTAGAMGERIEKEMPNGWIYSITGQIMFAADGEIYEGPGVPPDFYIENTKEEIDLGKDNVLDNAISIINN